MATITASIAVATGWRSFAAASLDTTTGTPALTRDRAFTAFAGSILGALGSSADASAGSGNRVNDVAQALKSALQNSTSGDAVGSLLGTIQAALSSASQSLGAAGFSSDAVQSLVTDFKNALSDQLNALAGSSSPAASPATPDPTAASASAADPTVVATPAPTPATTPATTPAATPTATSATTPATAPATSPASSTPAAGPTAATGSSAFTASYRVTESGTLELVTTEGDVVKIGFRSSEGGSATGVSANGAAGLATYAAISSYASTRFSVSVQGSLNADELKAVNDVLGQINTLASQFFSGNVSQAFASAAALNVDPNEIAGVALKLSERVSLRLATVGDPGTGPSGASSAPAAGAGSAAATAPEATTTPADPTATPADPTTTDPSSSASTASTPSGTSTPATPTTTSVGGGVSSLLSYLQQVLDVLGTTTTSGSVTFSAKAKLELLSSAVGAASLDPTEARAASLLKNVVGATTDATAQPSSATGAASTATA